MLGLTTKGLCCLRVCCRPCCTGAPLPAATLGTSCCSWRQELSFLKDWSEARCLQSWPPAMVTPAPRSARLSCSVSPSCCAPPPGRPHRLQQDREPRSVGHMAANAFQVITLGWHSMTDCSVQPGAVYRDTRIISVGLPAKWENMQGAWALNVILYLTCRVSDMKIADASVSV